MMASLLVTDAKIIIQNGRGPIAARPPFAAALKPSLPATPARRAEIPPAGLA
jgi:hypothetical protein